MNLQQDVHMSAEEVKAALVRHANFLQSELVLLQDQVGVELDAVTGGAVLHLDCTSLEARTEL